jgi:hypothetical protein
MRVTYQIQHVDHIPCVLMLKVSVFSTEKGNCTQIYFERQFNLNQIKSNPKKMSNPSQSSSAARTIYGRMLWEASGPQSEFSQNVGAPVIITQLVAVGGECVVTNLLDHQHALTKGKEMVCKFIYDQDQPFNKNTFMYVFYDY